MFRPIQSDREYIITLHSVLQDYIPHQLRQDVDKMKNIPYMGMVEFYMQNSNNKLRMYGTAQELEHNLMIYRDFPLRRKMFSVRANEIDNSTPKPYFNLKGEALYCKQDYLYHLHDAVHIANGRLKKLPEKLLEYMKKHEKRLDGCYEFVKYDKTIFSKVEEKFPFSQPLEVHLIKSPSGSLNNDGPQTEVVSVGPLRGVQYIEPDYLQVFDELISQHPTIFLPNHETKDKNATAVVQIFADEPNLKFVMESELFNAINLKNPDQEPLKCKDKQGYWKAIDMKEVYKTYRDQIAEIDFIRFPIIRTAHTAVPIATPTGEHCILAIDALLKIFRQVISVFDVFQKVDKNTWHMVSAYVKLLDKLFPPDMEYLYFINVDLVKKMELEADEYWKEFDKIEVKSIRDVGPNGFTVEDLEKELKYLGLNKIFPEITTNLDVTYSKFFSGRNPRLLETRDMFMAVEQRQSCCIFERFLSLHKLRHCQLLCRQVPYKDCDICAIVAKQTELELKSIKISSKDVEKKPEMEHIGRFEKLEANLATAQAVTEKLKKRQKTLEEKVEKTNELERKLKEAQTEMKALKKKNSAILVGKNEEVNRLKKNHAQEIAEKNEEINKLKKNHAESMRKKEAEMSLLKIDFAKTADEKLALGSKIVEHKAAEIKMKESNAELIEKIKSVEKTSESNQKVMEEKLKEKDAEIIEKDRILKELEQSTARQISEQIRINKGLQETVSFMTEQCESQGEIIEKQTKNIKSLVSRISSLLDPKHSEEGPCPFRKQLMGLRKMKDNLEVRFPLKLAKDISQRLTSLSTRPEIQEMATYEYQQFEGKHQMLLQEVCGNIQKLKDSGDVMPFPPLPEYPSFSDQFVNEYWNEVEKQKNSKLSAMNSGELQDSECLICFVEMKPDEQTLQCDHCRKILHMECASKWLKIHRSCPHCRREQLDPNEFPALV